MIYQAPTPDDSIDQADLVEGCPILELMEYDVEGSNASQVDVVSHRVLVLTQTCDLVNRKLTAVTVAVAHDAHSLVDQGLLKPADIRGPVRGGRVFGWYFLPANGELGLPEMIVDLRQLHTVRLELLTTLCRRGGRRARVVSPYREHLAKHFADTYSRIGLPVPYETEP